MNSIVLWAYLAFVSSLLDSLFTYRRIEKYGLQMEMSPVVRWAALKCKDELLGSFLGVMVPSWLLIGLGIFLGSPTVLACYAGMRVTLNWLQIAAIRTEEIYDAWLKEKKSGQTHNDDSNAG